MRRLLAESAHEDPNHFSTQRVPREQRRAAWDRALASVCGAFLTESGPDFDGRIDLRMINGLVASRIIHNSRSARRGRAEIRRRDPHCLHVIYQLSGRSTVCQAGREAALFAGEMTMLDSSSPSVLRFEEKNAQIWLHVTREELNSRGGTASPLLATTITGAPATLIGTIMRTAFAHPLAWSELQKDAIREALTRLVAATWCSGTQQITPAQGDDIVPPIVHVVQNYILTHLHSAALAPESIAKDHGLSVRHLHRLFKSTGTSLSHWIRRCRLDRCAADLLDDAQATERVTQIAFNWGFNDSAHFCRAFKAEFGQSPSEFRLDRRSRA